MSDPLFEATEQAEHELELPAALPILPLKETVVFPQSMSPLAIGQERSVRLIDDVVAGDRLLALVATRDGSIEAPGFDDIYEVGTVAIVHKLIKVPDGTLRILVQGLERVHLDHRIDTDPYLLGEFSALPDIVVETPELEALIRNVQGLFGRIISLAPYLPAELELAAANVDDPSALAHLVASTLRSIKTEERQELLETLDVTDRLRKVSAILSRELEVFELGSKIQSQVQSEMEKGQREYFLRQQLKAIQDELGEADPEHAEIEELRLRLAELTRCRRTSARPPTGSSSRLERLPPAAAEYGVIRTYLEWILTLPWGVYTVDNLDLEHARKVLDDDHFDLEKVKDRIVEYLAVAKLRNEVSGPDPLLRRPARRRQDVARALDRARARAQVRPPLGRRGARRVGDPRSPAHLHRLAAGHDHPLAARRRVLEPADPDRRDRQAGLRLARRPCERDARGARPGAEPDLPRPLPRPAVRSLEDALHLHGEHARHDSRPAARPDGRDHALGLHRGREARDREALPLPEAAAAPGLRRTQLAVSDKLLRTIIRDYTREAGVRNLERRIADVCRKAATLVATGRRTKVKVDDALLRDWLGPRRFAGEVRRRTAEPGVATGLAYTTAGGDILFIEATGFPGKGRLTITGQLGDVMRESAQAALSWVRSHADELGVPDDWFATHDVHVHVPAGAVPKDGPSAGVTMATALASLVRGEAVADDVGMTGEITLTGQVLPIGGLRRSRSQHSAPG